MNAIRRMLKRSAERIPGGRAEGMRPSDFDQEQLRKGTAVEMEHTDDPEVAREIAMDHQEEAGDLKGTEGDADKLNYYDLLEQLEKRLEDDQEKAASLAAVLLRRSDRLDPVQLCRLSHLLKVGSADSVERLAERLAWRLIGLGQPVGAG